MTQKANEHTTRIYKQINEGKSVPAETSSDRVKPEVPEGQQERPLNRPSVQDSKRLMARYGTDDLDFLTGIIAQIVKSSPTGDKEEINLRTSAIQQDKAKAHFKLMLMNQMSGVNGAIVTCLRQMERTQDFRAYEMYARLADKLMRTFSDQFRVFDANGASAENTIAVQNVSVNQGAQAVVANVVQPQTPRENVHHIPVAVSPPALTGPKIAPMKIIEETKEPAVVPQPIRRYQRKLK